MDKTNVIKLARILDEFIELESSFVLVDDIKAIQDSSKNGNPGITIITPYGEFHDSADFKELKTRIGDIQEALREQRSQKVEQMMAVPVKQAGQVIPIPLTSASAGNALGSVPSTTGNPPPLPPRIESCTTQITLSEQGARGMLFDSPNIRLVNREATVILSQAGQVVGTVSKAGAIEGNAGVSGVILMNGKYTIATNKYEGGNVLTIQYQVERVQ